MTAIWYRSLRIGFPLLLGCTLAGLACRGPAGIGGSDCRSSDCRVLSGTLSVLASIDGQDAGHGASIVAATNDTGIDAIAWTGLDPENLSDLHVFLSQWPVTAPELISTQDLGVAGSSRVVLLRRTDGTRLVLVGEPADFDQAHLVLYQETNNGFVKNSIDTLGNTGVHFAAALDDNDVLHLAWLETGAGQLRYATWRDGFIEPPAVVDTGFDERQGGPGGDLDLGVAIAVNAARTAISYYDATNGQLRVATPTTDGVWHIQVPGLRRTGQELTLDENGRAVLPEPMVMRYDHLELYADGDVVPDTAMAIAAPDEVVITNADASASYALDYVTPFSSDYGRASAIQVSDDGTVHIVVLNSAAGTLEYLANTNPPEQRDWLRETVDATFLPGETPAMLLAPLIDQNGVQRGQFPIVAYQRTSSADLVLAFRTRGTWEGNVTVLATQGYAGFDPALARRGGALLVAHRIFDPQSLLSKLEVFQAVLPQ